MNTIKSFNSIKHNALLSIIYTHKYDINKNKEIIKIIDNRNQHGDNSVRDGDLPLPGVRSAQQPACYLHTYTAIRVNRLLSLT